jgi:hypothetical protein
MSSGGFQVAFFRREVMETMLVRVFHFFFEEEETAAGVIVVLFLLFANLLNERLLDTGEQQTSHIVDNQTGGGNKHQDPKSVQQSQHILVETQRWTSGWLGRAKISLRKCKK